MLDYSRAANENSEPSHAGHELRNNIGGRDTQAALYFLRRLDAIAAEVSRLELCLQKQRTFWRRDIREAAIIAVILMSCGLLGFALVARFL